ncbi:hypothetical protein [Xanthomonas rydalmerensis]|uniref:Peptidase n=1 Tax=Xanthomonas rydalmerensis TaxID=3046274 RepID=A0ABZ0JLJ5_9XANT|nr:hypothetical protein [Xanthomonas sp. DM-2023]WOS40686.1 hypothetical protein QN243_20210 [Xanthomonas sp. DM-2023]WOS44870.1 hypothetical protein QN242_20210 [Xanthomonas sp. DM-2023]WOS49050.1 hypothetical protein QN240_20210 [Xanthomonas sp. DM-2023]WOS53230.1 hypothetical protein QN244_20215 [Xanthomonas sp. DM-2023]WOS57413.1 hypothetical protein QN245_20210 [Xanthomonas sp. DM-2023]
MQNQTSEDTAQAPGAADAATAAATQAAATVETANAAPAGQTESLIAQPVDGAPLAAVPLADQIPEKYRVMKDGVLDLEASTTKLAAAHKSLESKLGSAATSTAPAKPEDYAIKAGEGLGMSEEEMGAFVKDPMTQGFLAKLHAAGASNDVANLVLNGYLEFAPKLIEANAALSVDEARAEVAKLWADEATQQTNFAAAQRAINGYGTKNEALPGSVQRLHAKYGTDPDFIAFAAAIGGEMQEDKQVAPQGLPSAEDVESLQKSEAYWKPEHPDHMRVKAKVADFYARQYGTART